MDQKEVALQILLKLLDKTPAKDSNLDAAKKVTDAYNTILTNMETPASIAARVESPE